MMDYQNYIAEWAPIQLQYITQLSIILMDTIADFRLVDQFTVSNSQSIFLLDIDRLQDLSSN